MKDPERKNLINRIRRGEVDINNQSLFLPIVIKGLILKLNEQLTIRGIKIPHFIIHTGDDTMYLSVKGQDASIEPLEITNENYVYNSIPRCIVTIGGINLDADQLTSPYSRGQLQYEDDNNIYTFSGEFRRIPITISVSCKYYVDSWGDMMALAQQIVSKLAFVQTYNISYMGQAIKCSYNIPTSIEGEYTAELDGTTQDNKLRTTDISLDVQTNFPVWEPRTITSSDDIILYINSPNVISNGPGASAGVTIGYTDKNADGSPSYNQSVGRNAEYDSGGALTVRPEGYEPGPTPGTWIDPEGNVVDVPEDLYKDKKPVSLGKFVFYEPDEIKNSNL